MTDNYIKKSLYLVNRLDFDVWLLSGRLIFQKSSIPETAGTGSSLRSILDIAKDAHRSPKGAEVPPACVVFEEYNRGLSQ
tara:strand:- start:684 stop:923 length:240 start_codon:yes stop_codon:yes gene_type:complete